MNATDIFLNAIANFGMPNCVKTKVYYNEEYTYSFNSSGNSVLKKTESGIADIYCESDEFEDADACMAVIQAIVSDNFLQDDAVAILSNGRTRNFSLQLHESFPDDPDHNFLVNDKDLLAELKKAGIKHDVDFIHDNIDDAVYYHEKNVEKTFSGHGWADVVFSNGSVIRFTSKDGVIVVIEVEDEDEDDSEQ